MTSLKRRVLDWASTAAVHSGLTRLARQPWRGAEARRAIILAYHDVAETESEGCITPERLRRHIRVLKESFAICTVSEAVDALANPDGLERDLAVITFDDGYQGNHSSAWPVLRDEGVSATIYLTTGFLDGEPLWFDLARKAKGEAARSILNDALTGWRPAMGIEAALEEIKTLSAADRRALMEALAPFGREEDRAEPLSWDEARALADAGIELGAHTLLHPILSSLSPSEQRTELEGSRQRILEETGLAPRSFAIPNGTVQDFDADTLEIAREVGFDSVCTMVRGHNTAGVDPMRLKRIGVGADRDDVLRLRLSGLLNIVRSDTEMRVAPSGSTR